MGCFDTDFRAISSAVEHFVDIEGVTGSIPVSPTMNRQMTERSEGITEAKAQPQRRVEGDRP